jgi:hypothetical protein
MEEGHNLLLLELRILSMDCKSKTSWNVYLCGVHSVALLIYTI